MSEIGMARLAPDQLPSIRAHLGVIDLGTNAIRLQVARVYDDGSYRVIHDEREPVRLGEDVFRTGTLSAPAVERTLETLARFSATAQRHGAERVRSVATSAVREASNGDQFVAQVELATGVHLEIITGSQEARLIARGVLSGLGAPRGRIALVDVGGGSTEISVVDRGHIRFSRSVPLGSVRLTEMYCRTDPLCGEDELALRRHVRDELDKASGGARRMPPCTTVVGSAGTIGAMANFIRRRPSADRMESRLRSTFTMHELQQASAALRAMTLQQRQETPGIEERRSEIIVAGALILEEVCGFFGARSIRTVRRGLRDGLMLEEIERLGFGAGAQARPSRIEGRHQRRLRSP